MVGATLNRNSFLDFRFFELELSKGRWRSKIPSAKVLGGRELPTCPAAHTPRLCHHTGVYAHVYGWSCHKQKPTFGFPVCEAEIAEPAIGIKNTKCHGNLIRFPYEPLSGCSC